MTTDTEIEFKVETSAKERDQQLLDFITIDVLKIENKHSSSQYIIPLPTTPITNSSFKKHPMSWELIHLRIIHPSDSFTKEICCQITMYNLLHIKITAINKVTTVDTSNLQPGELTHMDFGFYNATSIRRFTSMLTVICAKTRMLCFLLTASKISPV